jgi:hypothetical protein
MNNSLMNCRWQVEAERLTAFDVANRITGQTLGLLAGGLPQVLLGDGRVLAVAQALPAGRMDVEKPIELGLEPFAVIVLEVDLS